MPEVQLDGWEDLIANMKALPARAQKNVLRGMVRSEASYLAGQMKERAPLLKQDTDNPHGRYPGQLKDAITDVSLNPSQTPGAVVAGVRIRGSRESLASTIQAGRALNRGKVKAAAKALGASIATGFYWRWIEYGSPHNEPPDPFARSTWDEQKSGSLQRMADYCRDRLDKLLHD